nr:LysR family transcriptional regulator [Shinella sp. JR1-6]
MLKNVTDVDLRLLRLFARVVRCGGFTAAQAELNMSQSNISMHIGNLERRLGYGLCERGKGGCQRRSKNRPRGGAKVGHCGAGLRPPGGLKPERGSRAGVAIFREVFSLPFGRGFGRDDSCRRSSRGC